MPIIRGPTRRRQDRKLRNKTPMMRVVNTMASTPASRLWAGGTPEEPPPTQPPGLVLQHSQNSRVEGPSYKTARGYGRLRERHEVSGDEQASGLGARRRGLTGPATIAKSAGPADFRSLCSPLALNALLGVHH